MKKRTSGAGPGRQSGENATRCSGGASPLRERLRPLQERVLARPATGFAADKAFFDELSGKS
jgi:antitoxin VapB